jgi:hypothetical protein
MEPRVGQRVFLYIDLLGFADIAKDDQAVLEIFERIDQLNVHRDGSFKVIAFSDTILVYGDGYWLEHPNQAVMWLIEFAEDLFFRLVSIDRHFRAYICRGGFDDIEMKNIRAFYGTALVNSYHKERDIGAMGVFIENELAALSDIYKTTPFDLDCHFVFVIRRIGDINSPASHYPIDPVLIEGAGFQIGYEIAYLRNIVANMRAIELPSRVRAKYALTWSIYQARYPHACAYLLANDFDPKGISTYDLAADVAKVGPEAGWFG